MQAPTESIRVTSPEMICTVASGCTSNNCCRAAANFVSDRATSVRWAPAFANCSAMARPMPVDPPVMSTCWPLKSCFLRLNTIPGSTTRALNAAIALPTTSIEH